MSYSPYARTPDATPRIGDWFSQSMTLFSREWGTWVLQGLICFGVALVTTAPGMALYFSFFFKQMANPNSEPDLSAMFTMLGALYGGSCLGGVAMIWLLGGMSRTAMKQLRGEPIRAADIFSAGDVFLPMLGAYFLAVLGSYFGILLCVVPGLIMLGMWIFVHPLIVEQRMGVMEAFRTSAQVTKPHRWSYVGWALLIGLVYYAGSMVGCGVLATLPIAIIMMTVSYRDVFEGAPAYANPQPVAMGPVVDYGPAGPPAAGSACPGCGRVLAAGAVVCPACGTRVG